MKLQLPHILTQQHLGYEILLAVELEAHTGTTSSTHFHMQPELLLPLYVYS